MKILTLFGPSLLLCSGMAFDAWETGDVSQVNRMSERLVGFVAGFAFAIGKATEIDRMLDGESHEFNPLRLGVSRNERARHDSLS